MQKNVQQKKKKKNTLKNVQQKNTEECTKRYAEKFTDKKFSRFVWSFFGSRKAEKIREKFPGEKKFCKKILVFLQKKKPEKFTAKNYRKKKFCQFFCIFLGFLALFGNFLVIIWLFSTYYLTMIWPFFTYFSNAYDGHALCTSPFQNGSIEAKKGARQKFVHFWKALTILMLKKYLKSWFIDTILHVFFKKPNFFSKIFFGLKSSRRSKN